MTDDPFRKKYRSLSTEESETLYSLKTRAADYWKHLDAMPPSREKALAVTKLEESVLWAVKALTG